MFWEGSTGTLCRNQLRTMYIVTNILVNNVMKLLQFNSVGHEVYRVCHDHMLHWRGREICRSHISFGSIGINPIPWIFIIIITISLMEQLELINILCLPSSFYSPPSGSGFLFLWRALSPIPSPSGAAIMVACCPANSPHPLQEGWACHPASIDNSPLLPGHRHWSKGWLAHQGIRILLQYLGIRVRRVVSPIFLNKSC